MSAKSFHEAMADKMGAMGGDDDAPPADGDDDDYGEGYKAAVASFIDAVHSKDADAAADSLKQAISLCSDKDDDAAPSGHAAMLLIPHGKGG